MQVKLLHDLVEEMAGADSGLIVEILFGKKDVNEFLISKKMELTINQVRNILYKLSADGLVSFIRKKDKRKGWYIYYWTLKTEKCLERLEKELMKRIEFFQGQLNNRETKRYYVCDSCAIEVSEEKALENSFTCDECAEVYVLSDNSKPIKETKLKISRTKKQLELIHKELTDVKEKVAKKRARAQKKEAKETAARKELLKQARAAARKKIAKKATKKAVKKATKKKATKKKVTKKKVVKKKVARKAVKKKATKKAVKKKSSLLKKVKKAVKKATKKKR